ncbi:hypothetical protein MMC21_003000 [Puttea exsequens]|nr:hypothetical protein [Puttea exsequens]
MLIATNTLAFVLFYLPLLLYAAAPATIALFLDEECEQASIINPSVKLALETCLVTHGAQGIAVQSIPQCTSGNASLVMYRDTSCAQSVDMDLDYGNCFFDGPNGIPAVAMVCGSEALAATATSTVSAGSSMLAVATGAAGDGVAASASATGTASPSPTSADLGSTTSEGAAPAPTSSSSATSSPQTSNLNKSSDSGTSSGISKGTQIGLGIGLPAAAIVIALLAWLWPKPFKMTKKNKVGGTRAEHGLPLPTWPQNNSSAAMVGPYSPSNSIRSPHFSQMHPMHG